MTTRKRWTPKEDSTLKSLVARFPSKTLRELSRKAATQLDRTESSCYNRLQKSQVKTGRNVRFTPEDDTIIRKHISMNPQNLSYAFFCAARELNRSEKSVENRWYSKVRLGKGIPNFSIKSNNVKCCNNVKNGKPYHNELVVESPFKQLFNKIKSLFHGN